MAGAGYSLNTKQTVTSGAKGLFGNVNYGGLNFAPLDSIPPSAFGGGGGTPSRTIMYVIGFGIVAAAGVAVYAISRKGK